MRGAMAFSEEDMSHMPRLRGRLVPVEVTLARQSRASCCQPSFPGRGPRTSRSATYVEELIFLCKCYSAINSDSALSAAEIPRGGSASGVMTEYWAQKQSAASPGSSSKKTEGERVSLVRTDG
jgi:hypothetical protein